MAGSTSPSGDSITTRYRRAPAVCGIIGSNNISCVTPGLRFTDDSLSFSSPINRLTRVDTSFENSLVTLAFSKRSSLATALGLRSEKVTFRSPWGRSLPTPITLIGMPRARNSFPTSKRLRPVLLRPSEKTTKDPSGESG